MCVKTMQLMYQQELNLLITVIVAAVVQQSFYLFDLVIFNPSSDSEGKNK